MYTGMNLFFIFKHEAPFPPKERVINPADARDSANL